MADVISWPGDLSTLAEVCARLRAGQLIGVASEGGFEALALGFDAGAVERLAGLAEGDVPLAVAMASPREIFDWAPHLRGAGLRTARDYWPGPLVLVSALGLRYGHLKWLPDAVRKHLERPEGLALRLSPQDDLSPLFAGLAGPVVIASLEREAANTIDVILDVRSAGLPAKLAVVVAGEHDVRVLRAGEIRREDLEASGRAKIVFVCTGNTCRSPMAEDLCRRLLADTLGVEVSELQARGYEVESAGLAAAACEPASPEAAAVMQALGGDLSGHSSQPLTMELVDRADHLFTMTAGHLRMLHSLRLPVGPEPQLLSAWGEDVPDPIGGPLELYQACAEQIRQSLRERLPQILEG